MGEPVMPSSTRRELPWADITRQVRRATLAYMNSTFDSPRKYVAVKHVANYLCFLEPPESIRYPHLCGQTYRTIATRVTMAMNKMGWVEYSKGVYEVPGVHP